MSSTSLFPHPTISPVYLYILCVTYPVKDFSSVINYFCMHSPHYLFHGCPWKVRDYCITTNYSRFKLVIRGLYTISTGVSYIKFWPRGLSELIILTPELSEKTRTDLYSAATVPCTAIEMVAWLRIVIEPWQFGLCFFNTSILLISLWGQLDKRRRRGGGCGCINLLALAPV